MKILAFTVILVFCAGHSVFSQTNAPADRFQDAVQHYKKADYRNAIRMFQSLIDEGYVDFDLYYNLGNASFKNGDLGASVLCYERALTIDPGNGDALHNLNVVRARLRDRVEAIPLLFFVRWWNDLRTAHTPTTFFIWSLAFFWLLAGAVFVFFAYRRVYLRRIALVAGIVFFSAFSIALALSIKRTEELGAHREAVIMATEVTVRSAPDETGVESFIIHEGLKVVILSIRDDRYQIRLEDGKNGWVEKSALVRI